MKIRLTTIDLIHDSKTFPEGAEVVADVDIPMALAMARLANNRAELVVGEDEVGPDLVQLMAGFEQTLGAFFDAAELLFARVEAVGVPAARAMTGLLGRADFMHRQGDLTRRGRALDELIAAADQALQNSQGSAAGSPAGDGAAAPGADQAGNGLSPASEGPAALQSAGPDVSSGVEQPAARLAHNQEVAGSNPAPAPKDAPQPAGGVNGVAAGAKAPAAKPAGRPRQTQAQGKAKQKPVQPDGQAEG